MPKNKKWVALACLTTLSFFAFQNCSSQLSSQQNLSSNISSQSASSQSLFMGGRFASPPTLRLPNGDTPTYFSGTSNSNQAPHISCSKQTYKVGEYAECTIENADEQTLCWQAGTKSAPEKKCIDYGWKFYPSEQILKISVAVVQSILGDYVIYAKNTGGTSTLDLHYLPADVIVSPYVYPTFEFREDFTANISKRVGESIQCPSRSNQFPGCTFSASGFRKRGVPVFADPYCSVKIFSSFDANLQPTNLVTLEVHGMQEGKVPKQSGWAIQDITQPGCVGSKGTVVNPTLEGQGTYMILGVSEWDEAFCIYACQK